MFIIDLLASFNGIQLWVIFFIENIVLFFMAVIIGKIIENKHTYLLNRDRKWIFSTLLCNTVITFIGYQLYLSGIINLTSSPSILIIMFDVLLLIIIMDFLMYIFHFTVHKIKWLYPIHSYHHLHIETNVYSLFVLHPIETLGFGFLWLMTLIIYPFNIYSVIIYLILNLVYGIVGHLHTDFFPNFWTHYKITNLISTTHFHQKHHQNKNRNFGFYFTFWDYVFNTGYSNKLK